MFAVSWFPPSLGRKSILMQDEQNGSFPWEKPFTVTSTRAVTFPREWQEEGGAVRLCSERAPGQTPLPGIQAERAQLPRGLGRSGIISTDPQGPQTWGRHSLWGDRDVFTAQLECSFTAQLECSLHPMKHQGEHSP